MIERWIWGREAEEGKESGSRSDGCSRVASREETDAPLASLLPTHAAGLSTENRSLAPTQTQDPASDPESMRQPRVTVSAFAATESAIRHAATASRDRVISGIQANQVEGRRIDWRPTVTHFV